MLNPKETVPCSAPHPHVCKPAILAPLRVRRDMAAPFAQTDVYSQTLTGRVTPTTGSEARWYRGQTGQDGCGKAQRRLSASTTERRADIALLRMESRAEVESRPVANQGIPSSRRAASNLVLEPVASSTMPRSWSGLRNPETQQATSVRQQLSQDTWRASHASRAPLSRGAPR